MTPAPAGPFMVVIDKLAQQVAECPSFRTRCGLASDDSQAFAKLFEGSGDSTRHLFYPALEDRLWTDHLPLGVVMLGDRWMLRGVAGGSQVHLPNPERTAVLFLSDWEADEYAGDSDTPRDLEASLRDFCNWFGAVARELADKSGLDDRVPIWLIDMILPPTLPSEEELATFRSEDYPLGRNYWTAALALECGI